METSGQSGAAGLSSREANRRLRRFGKNSFHTDVKAAGWRLLWGQFRSPIVLLLIAAAVLSAFLGDVSDCLIIVLIVLISALLGFLQERGANQAVNALLRLVQVKTRVLRDNHIVSVPLEDIVPGDVVSLTAGDLVPGDCLLLKADRLFADESVFTGESFPVEKQTEQPNNKLRAGSHLVSGTGTAVILHTGLQTALGQLAGQMEKTEPPTAFQQGIVRFGYLLMELTLVLVFVIFAINVFLHKPVLDAFLFSLALAVGLTPQLLPAIVTVNLSRGARQMARDEVIVKRLAVIEDLGGMTVLCSDKTGTLTEGQIRVHGTWDISGRESAQVRLYAWLNASLQRGFPNPIDEALCAIAPVASEYSLLGELPYDFERKCLTIQVKLGNEVLAITKGAFDQVAAICTNNDGLSAFYEELSGQGYRVLGLACKQLPNGHRLTTEDEKGMTFLGYISLFDPPKAGVAQTIVDLKELGVGLKIITGDNALVAANVARQIGLRQGDLLTGREISALSDKALQHRVMKTDIFAAVDPAQKERIIRMLRKAGQVVGYLGDGINDAPALHAANIGVSVNSAVDVAKSAADIVLLRQDLSVLKSGVLAGRKTFANSMKYIFMATSANFGNMFSMAGASLFLPFLPLLPKQVLLTNLLTDLPEMAIATDAVDEAQLQRPQHWNLQAIKRFMLVFGLLSSVFDYLTFLLLCQLGFTETLFQTGWFVESVLSASLIVLVIRTRRPFFKSRPAKWLLAGTFLVILTVVVVACTPLGVVFNFHLLPARFWLWMPVILTTYLLAAELAKHWFFKHAARHRKA